mmetsp:Transcript_52617/g.104429  ORF Transcript_52617/g.104429 Transcript_52617/m.104429 type:complete len:471 (+) Transcript_52617:60-1472(+)
MTVADMSTQTEPADMATQTEPVAGGAGEDDAPVASRSVVLVGACSSRALQEIRAQPREHCLHTPPLARHTYAAPPPTKSMAGSFMTNGTQLKVGSLSLPPATTIPSEPVTAHFLFSDPRNPKATPTYVTNTDASRSTPIPVTAPLTARPTVRFASDNGVQPSMGSVRVASQEPLDRTIVQPRTGSVRRFASQESPVLTGAQPSPGSVRFAPVLTSAQLSMGSIRAPVLTGVQPRVSSVRLASESPILTSVQPSVGAVRLASESPIRTGVQPSVVSASVRVPTQSTGQLKSGCSSARISTPRRLIVGAALRAPTPTSVRLNVSSASVQGPTTSRLNVGSASARMPANPRAASPTTIRVDQAYSEGKFAWPAMQNGHHQVTQNPRKTSMMEPVAVGTCGFSTTTAMPSTQTLPIGSWPTIAAPQQLRASAQGVVMEPVDGGMIITGMGVHFNRIAQKPAGPILVLDDTLVTL